MLDAKGGDVGCSRVGVDHGLALGGVAHIDGAEGDQIGVGILHVVVLISLVSLLVQRAVVPAAAPVAGVVGPDHVLTAEGQGGVGLVLHLLGGDQLDHTGALIDLENGDQIPSVIRGGLVLGVEAVQQGQLTAVGGKVHIVIVGHEITGHTVGVVADVLGVGVGTQRAGAAVRGVHIGQELGALVLLGQSGHNGTQPVVIVTAQLVAHVIGPDGRMIYGHRALGNGGDGGLGGQAGDGAVPLHQPRSTPHLRAAAHHDTHAVFRVHIQKVSGCGHGTPIQINIRVLHILHMGVTHLIRSVESVIHAQNQLAMGNAGVGVFLDDVSIRQLLQAGTEGIVVGDLGTILLGQSTPRGVGAVDLGLVLDIPVGNGVDECHDLGRIGGEVDLGTGLGLGLGLGGGFGGGFGVPVGPLIRGGGGLGGGLSVGVRGIHGGLGAGNYTQHKAKQKQQREQGLFHSLGLLPIWIRVGVYTLYHIGLVLYISILYELNVFFCATRPFLLLISRPTIHVIVWGNISVIPQIWVCRCVGFLLLRG